MKKKFIFNTSLNICFLLPLIYALLDIFYFQTADIIKQIYTISGFSAILLFMLVFIVKFKKIVGIYIFFYSFLHVGNYFLLDHLIELKKAFFDIFLKPYLLIGLCCFSIISMLFILSFKKPLLKYKFLYKSGFLGLILSLIHYLLAQKVLEEIEYIISFLATLIIIFEYKKVLNKKMRFVK